MKKILLGLGVGAGVLLAAAVIVAAVFLVWGRKEYIQERTDTEPIYNYFPEVPETSEIQWCSRTSVSIGPSTLRLYIFAFYDHDISSELQDMGMEIAGQTEDIELYYVPDSINGQQNWRHIENGAFAFQTGIKDSKKLYTTVSINDAGTILYIEAIGDYK